MASLLRIEDRALPLLFTNLFRSNAFCEITDCSKHAVPGTLLKRTTAVPTTASAPPKYRRKVSGVSVSCAAETKATFLALQPYGRSPVIHDACEGLQRGSEACAMI